MDNKATEYQSKPWLIAVAGPTASGKTALAIELAKYFSTEIISFDSRQCYAELNIGVARPTVDELAAVPHHFIASHSIYHPLDAASYASQALDVLQTLFSRKEVVIAVGGTGLYLKSLLYGLDEMPEIPTGIREDLRIQYAQQGFSWLAQTIRQADPAFAEKGEMQNPHRMLRALETILATGTSILDFRRKTATPRPFRWMTIGIDLPKNLLHERIAQRTIQMKAAGLTQEATSLFDDRELAPLQTVGYREIFDMMLAKSDETTAYNLIATHTRQYAKRQLTWFRKQEEVNWIPAAEASVAIQAIKEHTGLK